MLALGFDLLFAAIGFGTAWVWRGQQLRKEFRIRNPKPICWCGHMMNQHAKTEDGLPGKCRCKVFGGDDKELGNCACIEYMQKPLYV